METLTYRMRVWGEPSRTIDILPWYDDSCDCDRKCPKCGKKKRRTVPYYWC